MPRIFDNIVLPLLPTLQATLGESERADFCVGYFNLRGWKHLDKYIEKYSGENGAVCRLMVGMQKAPADELRDALSLLRDDAPMDQQSAVRFKEKMAREFREQLMVGAPTNEDEAALRRLAAQLRAGKLVVKLFLKHTLHAKLYLCYRNDVNNPVTGFVGSSNLTFSGLKYQGELNVDVLEHDATAKLSQWFEARWCERFCLDVSEELTTIIETSWARQTPIPPHHIYLKMAYHLSQEARAGLAEFSTPRNMRSVLLPFQEAAVKIAARHIHKRGGVVIGDVVGLGKTLMATALAKMFDELGMEVLVLCPKNLVKMWKDYFHRYEVRGGVMSVSTAIRELPDLPRHRMVLIDESHNLRNREGKVYQAIKAYVEKNDSKCILLTATPFNKTYLDLSNQLRLFVPDNRDLGVRPEQYLKSLAALTNLPGEVAFTQRHTGSPRCLPAFEKSEYPDDWRELLRLYMVRRTRSFIAENYGILDAVSRRRYLEFADKSRSYFPLRVPKTVKFATDTQFEQLYSPDVVSTINDLALPRYGLGNYVAQKPSKPATGTEKKQLDDLGRAGKRLMGFCRTNLFKRLESSGVAFLLSVERHLLRNFVFLYALENGLPLPIGTQNADVLDTRSEDEDTSVAHTEIEYDSGDDTATESETEPSPSAASVIHTEAAYRARARSIYERYATEYKKRFKWLPAGLFTGQLAEALGGDIAALTGVLQRCNAWEADKDQKLGALLNLVQNERSNDKVLVFTQFADTARYLAAELAARGVAQVECATGQSADPAEIAWRFSPVSNGKADLYPQAKQIRVLVATDVLSEGQNLQDSFTVVNYDLPWAIIRLIQRAGRVDRIGQKAEEILCYSFLPADGVESIINLRSRVIERLQQNAEVVGTDEAFFEGDNEKTVLLRDLYNEKAGLLDGDEDGEVDLASYAFQIWQNAIKNNPGLRKQIEEMPNVVYSAKAHIPLPGEAPEGVLLFLRGADGTDALAYVNKHGNSVTEAQFAILRAAQCEPTTPAVERLPDHHALVESAANHIRQTETSAEGTLGRPTGARYRTYDLLKQHVASVRETLLYSDDLEKTMEELLKFPLTQTATDTLNVHLRGNDTAERIAELVLHLRDENRLTIQTDDALQNEPRILCSMGLVKPTPGAATNDPRDGLFGSQTMLIMPPS